MRAGLTGHAVFMVHFEFEFKFYSSHEDRSLEDLPVAHVGTC